MQKLNKSRNNSSYWESWDWLLLFFLLPQTTNLWDTKYCSCCSETIDWVWSRSACTYYTSRCSLAVCVLGSSQSLPVEKDQRKSCQSWCDGLVIYFLSNRASRSHVVLDLRSGQRTKTDGSCPFNCACGPSRWRESVLVASAANQSAPLTSPSPRVQLGFKSTKRKPLMWFAKCWLSFHRLTLTLVKRVRHFIFFPVSFSSREEK